MRLSSRKHCYVYCQEQIYMYGIDLSNHPEQLVLVIENQHYSANDGKPIDDMQKQYMLWASHADVITEERRIVRYRAIHCQCESCRAFQFEHCMFANEVDGQWKEHNVIKITNVWNDRSELANKYYSVPAFGEVQWNQKDEVILLALKLLPDQQPADIIFGHLIRQPYLYDGANNNNKLTTKFKIQNRLVSLPLRKNVRVCDVRMLVRFPGIESPNVFIYADLPNLVVPMHCIIMPTELRYNDTYYTIIKLTKSNDTITIDRGLRIQKVLL